MKLVLTRCTSFPVTNYYQNHRRYVKSINTAQLRGDATSFSSLQNGDCKPVATDGTLPVYPCGLIANSVFNGKLNSLIKISKKSSRELCSEF